MDRLDELLRGARYAPPPSADGLQDAVRRGRRRQQVNRSLIGAANLAVILAVGMWWQAGRPGGGDDLVVVPGVTPPAVATSTPSMVAVGSIRWRAADVSTDGRMLTLHFQAGPADPALNCSQLVRPKVVEAGERVTVTLEHVLPPDKVGKTGNCWMALHSRTATVTLDAPLAGRRVFDGSDGQERRVSDR